MSFPPGTEMFQFPGFASPAYGFGRGSPKGRGFPIRTSADQRSLASPRGFSQRATSFIASWRQGIHRTPFFHSSTPPPARSTNTQGSSPSAPDRASNQTTDQYQLSRYPSEQPQPMPPQGSTNQEPPQRYQSHLTIFSFERTRETTHRPRA